jgi:hypothetical protein
MMIKRQKIGINLILFWANLRRSLNEILQMVIKIGVLDTVQCHVSRTTSDEIGKQAI